jgi:hypothetical protein
VLPALVFIGRGPIVVTQGTFTLEAGFATDVVVLAETIAFEADFTTIVR